MATTSTIKVPHLGGITAGYRLSGEAIDPSKPTLVLINSMCTTAALFDAQFTSKTLTDAVNLLAIEPLGHGATSCASEHFTYWDSALMALQVMEALGVDKAFALGTSQGGWVIVRMALLAPEKILGLLPLGSSMDCESAESREKGCWNPKEQLGPFFESWGSAAPTPDFVVDEVWRGLVASVGFGSTTTPELVAYWDGILKEVYKGDEGRKKVRMALLNLMERDGLLSRLRDIQCPVYWLQGTEDPVYRQVVPAEHIQLFTAAPEATLTLVEGGGHYLSATNPEETEQAVIKMITQYA